MNASHEAINFNPRSREGGDESLRFELCGHGISTHAPVKGATRASEALRTALRNFNPRSREGSDLSCKWLQPYILNFNPRSREGSDS